MANEMKLVYRIAMYKSRIQSRYTARKSKSYSYVEEIVLVRPGLDQRFMGSISVYERIRWSK